MRIHGFFSLAAARRPGAVWAAAPARLFVGSFFGAFPSSFLLLPPLLPQVPFAETLHGTVTHVIDGDTLVLDGYDRVRLLDINTPELAHDGLPAQPGGPEATAFLKTLAEGKTATLETGTRQRDDFGRILAQVYLEDTGERKDTGDGTAKGSGRVWVNGALVQAGMAHVYTFPDNADKPADLLKLEAQARARKAGLWALPRWQVRDAATCCADADIDLFMLVEGRPLRTEKTRNRIYFHFGADPRTDFSFFINAKDLKYFKKAGVNDVAAFYGNKTLRVRGYLQPVNGVALRMTHPAQIEIIP